MADHDDGRTVARRALARMRRALEKGAGVRLSAYELECLNYYTIIGEMMSDAASEADATLTPEVSRG